MLKIFVHQVDKEKDWNGTRIGQVLEIARGYFVWEDLRDPDNHVKSEISYFSAERALSALQERFFLIRK